MAKSVRLLIARGLILDFFLMVSVIWFFSFTPGCGRKGPPVPRGNIQTEIVRDLKLAYENDTLILRWSGNNDAELAVFAVYRARRSLIKTECQKCPLEFEQIADFDISGKSVKTGYEYIDRDASPGFRYYYKIRAANKYGREGADSNMVDFAY
ncbi:hypothetical protein QUF76_13110 [Desulfobacterales bacterium HSG16]|nr:hypothetical protein [Desulfobacterales bacterium HSG16]